MNRFAMALTVVAGLLLAAGCDKEESYVTWSTGLHVQGTSTQTETAVAYAELEGQGAAESKGTILSGILAGASSGKKTVVTTTTNVEDWQVVGQTKTDNQLVPGREHFSPVPVAVVEGTTVTTGVSDATEQFVEEQGGKQHSYQTESHGTVGPVTVAGTWGLAGDQYVIKVSDLKDLWQPDIAELWEKAGTSTYPGIDYQVLAGAGVGDFWVDPTGTTLYQAVATEGVNIGNTSVSAVKVEMREAGNLDQTTVIDRCLSQQTSTAQSFTTSGDNVIPGYDSQSSTTQVSLDAGCSGSFLHHKAGYQWWYNNVLVQEDATYYTVTVNNFGYAWVEGSVIKQDKTKPQNGNPSLFAEYTFTTKHRQYQATTYETVATTQWTAQ